MPGKNKTVRNCVTKSGTKPGGGEILSLINQMLPWGMNFGPRSRLSILRNKLLRRTGALRASVFAFQATPDKSPGKQGTFYIVSFIGFVF